MKVTEDAANRVLRSKVLCVINLVGLFPPDGLHAGDPGHMEDEDDFLTFLSDVRDYQNGVGPADANIFCPCSFRAIRTSS